ncbi:MAG: hypothetical protein V4501_00865, partial [Pseudomonadota bacterium]
MHSYYREQLRFQMQRYGELLHPTNQQEFFARHDAEIAARAGQSFNEQYGTGSCIVSIWGK